VSAAESPPDLDTLRDRAISLSRAGTRAILGIAGPPGAGKSTLAQALVAAVDALRPGMAAYVPMDGFHLADVQLARLGLLDRKGAPQTFDVGGYAATLERLRDDSEPVVYVPGFDRELEQPVAASLVVPSSARLIVTEGNYLLLADGGWQRVADAVDEIWYVDLDDPIRVARLIARHVEFGKQPDAARAWVERSDEANARLVASTRTRADMVVEFASITGLEAVDDDVHAERDRGEPGANVNGG
jgi:pantothenate kinase